MERFSQRESVLLGYSPRVSLTNSTSNSPRTACRGSDFDFHDVFGGPPRRASAQEKRCSFSEAAEYYGEGGGGGGGGDDDEAFSCSRVGEMPVFGEENANRRRYPSDNFFDDIFRGDESLSSTPRKRDRDPFASAPGSRVLSPAHPLPPKAEPLGSSSMAPQFSLPAKLAEGMDLDVFGSNTTRNPSKYKDSASSGVSFSSSSSSNLSRFSSHSIRSQEEMRNDAQSCHRQRPLSREVFLSREESSNSNKSDKIDPDGIMKKEPNGSEVPTDGSQFHFSIYKWAGKGVPLAMPLRGSTGLRMKESVKFERCSSWNTWLAGEGKARVSPTKSFRTEWNRQENDAILLAPESETPSSLQRVVEDVLGKAILPQKEITVLTEEVHKPALKTPCSLFFDDDYEQGTNGITEKGEDKESTVQSAKNPSSVVNASQNGKKQDGKRTALNDVEADKASFQDAPIHPAGDNLGRNRVKGKVKEFVKIFSQEASPKLKEDIGSRSQSFRWKKRGNYREGDEVSVSAAGLDEKTPKAHVNNTIPEASVVADEYLKQSKKEHSSIKTTNHISSDTSSGEKDNSSSTTASISNGSKATAEDTDESFQVNFLIKELTQGSNELPQSGDDHEEIQVIDAKIRLWSNGKKGNIRSLLSTLQYVLWPESGWKPVPLVDIIEGNSVKRSYQKALLCLHPDKLQQKGAASNQKYIAEKVFEILQEAWNHFNSLGSL